VTKYLPDNSEIKGESQRTSIKYDQLVYAVGAENQTFGIPGVREHACFLKVRRPSGA
jgi:NADH:ubiquinone reductase (non-electrogenic)